MGRITNERAAITFGHWVDACAGIRRCQLEISALDFWLDPLLAIAIAEAKIEAFNVKHYRWRLEPV